MTLSGSAAVPPVEPGEPVRKKPFSFTADAVPPPAGATWWPRRTTVGVTELALGGAVEIEVIAGIPEGAA